MWEVIIYCLKCLGIVIAGAFGSNPVGLTWKTGTIGVLTFYGLIGLVVLISYLAYLMICKPR